MTIGEFVMAIIVSGMVIGAVIFGIAYAFRDTFEAAANLGFISIWLRALVILALPGAALGWGLTMLVPRTTDPTSWMLCVSTLTLGAAIVGTSLALEHRFAHSVLDALAGPTILAGIIASMTPPIRGWFES